MTKWAHIERDTRESLHRSEVDELKAQNDTPVKEEMPKA